MKLINKILNLLRYSINSILSYNNENYEKIMLLQAKTIKEQRVGAEFSELSNAEFRIFSQWGEDGIIEWLISCIPNINRRFIEFGVQNYHESNTRYLLISQNWSGLVIDGSMAHVDDIRSQNIYWRHTIEAKCAFIDIHNINKLIFESKYDGEIGLLSIDIDGNDYWVWEAIDVVSPAIVVCEYNAVLGDLLSLTIPYEADFFRTRSHYSNLYFGASIRALIELGKSKGYVFVGSTSSGCNAFFVRHDLAVNITNKMTNIVAYPSCVREARDNKGRLTFVSGNERQKLIAHLPFVDPIDGNIRDLSAWGLIESNAWKQGEGVKF